MSSTLQAFSQIAPRYRAVFFDAFGVLRIDDGLVAGVEEALARLRAAGTPYWVLTNDSSRPPEYLSASFRGLVGPELLISSGSLFVEHVRAHPPEGTLAYVGPERCEPLLDSTGLPWTSFKELEEEAFASVGAVVVMDQTGFEWNRELDRILNLLRRRPELPLFVPNPDVVFPTRTGVALASGALAALLRAALPKVEVQSFGKPCAEIFTRGLELARAQLGDDLRASEVLMVGDTLQTDIRGAQALGIATALVLSGNTPPADLDAEFGREGVRPDHVVASVGS